MMTERSARMRHNVQEINEAILSAVIGIQGRAICEGDPLEVRGVRFGAATHQLHRVFNRASFSQGGRFYGPWWQNIPSELRADITINGIQTVEMDYPRLHPTLMCMQRRVSLCPVIPMTFPTGLAIWSRWHSTRW